MADTPTYTDESPEPVANDGPCTWDLVIADMQARDKFGLTKYGKRLQPHNGRNPVRDAYEEVLDLAAYLRTTIEEVTDLRDENARLLAEVDRLWEEAQNAHLSIRQGYDKTVADSWRAEVAKKDAEIDRLREENANLKAAVDEGFAGIHSRSDARTFLESMGPDERGGWAMRFHGEQIEALCELWLALVREDFTAENYLETRVDTAIYPAGGDTGLTLVVTAQLGGRKTPHELRREAEAEADRLRAGIRDAVEWCGKYAASPIDAERNHALAVDIPASLEGLLR